ncbi:MAG: hypothetical protein HYZ24_18040 [Chloroflexi bacterium]|nr:hypothetical protein [Chloroflexota bacterium]
MIFGTITVSILDGKVAKRKLKKVSDATPDIQVAIFQETMAELETYLDTNDTRKLNLKSLGIIRDDMLQMVAGIRDLRPRLIPGKVKSIDGTLEKMRCARDDILVVMGMFDYSGVLRESQSRKFFAQLRSTRKNLEEAIKYFK